MLRARTTLAICLAACCAGCSALVAVERGSQLKGVDKEGVPRRLAPAPPASALAHVHSLRVAAHCSHDESSAGPGLPARGDERLQELLERVRRPQGAAGADERHQGPGAPLADHLVPLPEPALQDVAAGGRSRAAGQGARASARIRVHTRTDRNRQSWMQRARSVPAPPLSYRRVSSRRRARCRRLSGACSGLARTCRAGSTVTRSARTRAAAGGRRARRPRSSSA
eukprot:4380285-Prymnesium_polylepis.1